MASVKNVEGHRAGWSGKGVAALTLLVGVLLVTGIVLEMWDTESLAQLTSWKMQVRRLALVIHGTGAWVLCFLIGRWAWPHLQQVWQLRTNTTWWLGIVSAAIATVTAVSGWFLLYGSGESHDAAASLHWWFGLPWPLLLYLHAKRRAPWRRQPRRTQDPGS